MADEIILLDDVSKQANALGQAFKENQANISRLQLLHDELEVQWLKEKNEVDQIVLEGNSLVSQLCMLEEKRSRLEKSITALENEIDRTTSEHEETKKKVIDKMNKYENMKRELSDYTFKMNKYTNHFTAAENNTPLLQQVASVKNEIEELKTKKSDLEKWQFQMLTNANGQAITKEIMKTELIELKKQVDEMRDTYKDKKQELESARDKRKGMEMTNFVLTKRNSALLTRMNRKVEEQKEKHSTVVSQRDYLAKIIDTTKRKLERFDGSQ